MSVALLNRFVPPDRAPTAVALARVAALLAARAPKLNVSMIGAGRAYVGGGAVGEQWLWRRAVAGLADGRRLAERAAAQRAILSLTDPPFLSCHLARRLPPETLWLEWTMDLYPHAVWAALGRRPRGFPWFMERCPDLRLHLGPGQADFLATEERRRRSTPQLILPAGVRDACPSPAPALTSGDPVRLVYAGNHGRAHWADALAFLAAACDPARFRLTIAAHGVGAVGLKSRLASFSHVELRDAPLSDTELDAAHVHLVSLEENWTHVCVPSKAISALSRGRPILFFGAAASDVWGWADGGGWRTDPNLAAVARDLPGILQEIAAPAGLAAATRRAERAGDRLRAAEGRALDAVALRLVDAGSGAR